MAINIFQRSKKNPILKPIKGHSWESKKVYNPGVLYHNNEYHLYYRAVGKRHVSSIGYGRSKDGENFKRSRLPILGPKDKIESLGLEDPRLSRVGNKYFLTYTAYDGQSARLCFMISQNMKNWQRRSEIFPDWNSWRAGEFILPWDQAQKTETAKHHWLKSGAIFPEKLNGRYWLFFGDRLIWPATSLDGLSWIPEYEPFITPRRGLFDSVHVEVGPPPLRTDQGWLLLYHGVDENITYRLGYFLLDLHDPLKIIKRSKQPIFAPQEGYELAGKADIGGNQLALPKIIFCNGATLKSSILRIYYGASDSVICTATANLNDILKSD